MNLYLYTVDTWNNGVVVEFGRLTEYADAIQTAERVERNFWKNLMASQLYLVQTDGSIDLDYDGPPPDEGILDQLLLWEWSREAEDE